MSSSSKVKLCKKLKEVRKFIPTEFNRKLRPLTDLAYWKASEYRLFLLYVGSVVLRSKSILCKERYNHFLKFALPMRFLLQKNGHPTNLRSCHEVLCEFVHQSAVLYGKKFVSYNVHSVIHIVDDYWHFGSLEDINAFVFESYLGLLKNSVRSGYKPLQQVARHAHHYNRMCTFITNSINQRSTTSKSFKWRYI